MRTLSSTYTFGLSLFFGTIAIYACSDSPLGNSASESVSDAGADGSSSSSSSDDDSVVLDSGVTDDSAATDDAAASDANDVDATSEDAATEVDSGVADSGVPTYAVGGSVSNLVGSLVLQNNGGDDITLTAEGTFAFATKVASDQGYNVTIKEQPRAVVCSVSDGTAATLSADISNVAVTCIPTGPSGIRYYFPFDGDTKDYSGNKWDLTNSGATLIADRAGNADSAFSFDGVAAYMVAAGDGLPINNDARTLTAWVNMADQHGQWGFLHWGTGDCSSLMFGLGYEGGTTFWGGCNDYVAPSTFATSAWTFVAVVFTPTNGISLFTNGTKDSTILGADLATNASQLFVGAETTSNDVNDFRNFFAGAIDSVRIYDRALSDQEVADIYALP